MDTRLLRLAWRLDEHPEVRAWRAADGTEIRVIPAHRAMSGTTEVLYQVPGIEGTFIVRPNMPSQRSDFRRVGKSLAHRGRLLDAEPEDSASDDLWADYDDEPWSGNELSESEAQLLAALNEAAGKI